MAENITRKDEDPDSALIEGLRNRDERALASAYDQYSCVVYSLLLRITQNGLLAEDLLVEVFFRLWTHAHVFSSDRGSLAVWLLCIARNMALDQVLSSEARLWTRIQPIENLDFFCCTKSSDNSSAVAAHVIVQAAFRHLTVNQQRVLEMAYFQGCSQSEIATRLHEPLGTVKSWMRSGLSSMRTAIQGPPQVS